MSSDSSVETTWAALGAPWQAAFELAWEALRAGSVPVGAVVVDPGGGILARGRSRAYETSAPSGQIAGTYLAHAEINALLSLPRGDYWDHVLYTTVEPCLLCTAALTHAHVGTVRYVADDPLWAGICGLPDLNAHVARRWATRERHLDGPLSSWALLLPLVFYLDHGAMQVEQAYVRRFPELVALAQALLTANSLSMVMDWPLVEALSALWDRLAQASHGDGCSRPDY